MLAFVFRVSEREVHVAVVVDEGATESEFAERAVRPVSNAQWLSGRNEITAHRIERATFDAVWQEYLSGLETPFGDPRRFSGSSS
jgi:DNA-binding transcriptional regulator YdaS (Cro superfamily)